ncbi:hypothetical protein FUMI01_23170 [Flavobacterium sp. UMI-01]|nr:hypothetical protein FUMI01_23170 [Flavobacterium sp. UMI-01]
MYVNTYGGVRGDKVKFCLNLTLAPTLIEKSKGRVVIVFNIVVFIGFVIKY